MLPGDTVMLLPVPALVPPQEPLNHSAEAPVPDTPPTKLKVVLPPAHIVVVPLMLVGAVEGVLTVTVVCTQAPSLQLVPVPGS